MPLPQKLLDVLACPDDKTKVKYALTGKKENLSCPKCKRVFEIKKGVPIMLPKSA